MLDACRESQHHTPASRELHSSEQIYLRMTPIASSRPFLVAANHRLVLELNHLWPTFNENLQHHFLFKVEGAEDKSLH